MKGTRLFGPGPDRNAIIRKVIKRLGAYECKTKRTDLLYLQMPSPNFDAHFNKFSSTKSVSWSMHFSLSLSLTNLPKNEAHLCNFFWVVGFVFVCFRPPPPLSIPQLSNKTSSHFGHFKPKSATLLKSPTPQHALTGCYPGVLDNTFFRIFSHFFAQFF